MAAESLSRCVAVLCTALLVAVGTVLYARVYAGMLVPVFEPLFPLLYDRLDVFTLELVQLKSEWGYRLIADNTRPIVVGNHWLPAHLGLSSFTLLAHSLQHVLFYALVGAGGACYYRCSPWRLLALSVVMLLLLEIVDIPFVLIASIEDLLLYNADPDSLDDSLWVKWLGFLTNGGRIGLSMIAAWCAVIASRRVAVPQQV